MSRSTHASKPRRNKKFARRGVNPIAAFDALHANHEAQLIAANEAENRKTLNSPLDEGRQNELAIAFRSAFNGLISGTSPEDNFHVLAFSMNIALVLCERGFGADHVSDLVAAQEAVFRISVEQKKTGKWVFDPVASPEDCRLIEYAFDVHEAQVGIVTQAELMSAVAEVNSRMEQTNVYEHAA